MLDAGSGRAVVLLAKLIISVRANVFHGGRIARIERVLPASGFEGLLPYCKLSKATTLAFKLI
jgi:hypothetical protein